VARELGARGHEVVGYEPGDSWSRAGLVAEHGTGPLRDFAHEFPELQTVVYGPDLDLEDAVQGAAAVLVHEWNDPTLVAALGRLRRDGGAFRLFFHDTHHRSVTAPDQMAAYDLRHYDGVLAFGDAVRDRYLELGWAARAWTWHEAADVRLFRLLPGPEERRDLVWIGNWGDEERSAALREFLLGPARLLGLTGTVHGVRYPAEALAALGAAGLEYCGWLPNHRAPEAYAAHRLTVHVPRGPYRELPGIPTIRVFEAMACGIPLISAPWEDREGLFAPGSHLVARTGAEMTLMLDEVLNDPGLAADLSRRGLESIQAGHTCAHRVDQLLGILAEVGVGSAAVPVEPSPR
jgi:spore maturation protein CgeB